MITQSELLLRKFSPRFELSLLLLDLAMSGILQLRVLLEEHEKAHWLPIRFQQASHASKDLACFR